MFLVINTFLRTLILSILLLANTSIVNAANFVTEYSRIEKLFKSTNELLENNKLLIQSNSQTMKSIEDLTKVIEVNKFKLKEVLALLTSKQQEPKTFEQWLTSLKIILNQDPGVEISEIIQEMILKIEAVKDSQCLNSSTDISSFIAEDSNPALKNLILNVSKTVQYLNEEQNIFNETLRSLNFERASLYNNNYKIEVNHSKLCLNSLRTEEGLDVVFQDECTSEKKWKMVPIEGSYNSFKIRFNENDLTKPQQCMSIIDQRKNVGAFVTTEECSNSNQSQRWQMVQLRNGSTALLNLNSGLCLDVYAARTAPTHLTQSGCHYEGNQLFSIKMSEI